MKYAIFALDWAKFCAPYNRISKILLFQNKNKKFSRTYSSYRCPRKEKENYLIILLYSVISGNFPISPFKILAAAPSAASGNITKSYGERKGSHKCIKISFRGRTNTFLERKEGKGFSTRRDYLW